MQTADEKLAAITTVLWLLPLHYSMIRITRAGVHFRNELEVPDLPGWTPPTPEEFEGWPVEEMVRWHAYQRYLSKKYRLWPISRAFESLREWRPELAVALVATWVEDEQPNWYEPERVSDRCMEGLRYIAERVSGEVPFFQEAVVQVRPKPKMNVVARNKRIRELAKDGHSKSGIARELGCSRNTVKAVLSGMRVLHGRLLSATGA